MYTNWYVGEHKMMMMMKMKMKMNVWTTMSAISNRVMFCSTLAGADLTFNVGQATKTSYSTFLTNLRNLVSNPNVHYGQTNIPVMSAPTNPPKYITIDLHSNRGTVITVALSRNDLYIVGYLDKICGNYRSHIFKDAPVSASTLFPVATGVNRVRILYDSSYAAMEKNAGVDRSKLGLGVVSLNRLFNAVYSQKLNVQTEAKFLLTAVQMISESARFKFIENKILGKFSDVYNPDPKAIEFEKSWDKTSKSVKNSKNGVIDPPLLLTDESGKQWVVTKVAQVAGDVGLFKNVEKSSELSSLDENQGPQFTNL
ncbi:ribosome-inactivating protein PD-L3/PD-L4-like [Silene latifolia]|uniref:ribosome-inactivating protein PD-L3/PD-L4-like n=1 Tax=Silene latifolia TaxID=37657 RepID=UPI003D782A07